MRKLLLLTALAAVISGCGGGSRVMVKSGDDEREAIDTASRKSGVWLAPLVDASDAPGGGIRGSCLEEANGAVERSLKIRYDVKTLLPDGDDGAGSWSKLPANAKNAKGSRYIVHVERVTCGARAQVELAIWEREEGKELVRIVGEEDREGAAGARVAAGNAAVRVFHGFLTTARDVTLRYLAAPDLAVVVCHWNPAGYRSRLENFARFAPPFADFGDAFCVVECATGDAPFELPNATLRVRANDALWQKERLLSLAIETLPTRFTKVAWLDADLLFQRNDWALETSRALDEWPILQPFSRAIRLPRDTYAFTENSEVFESFAAAHRRRPELHLHGHYELHGHTGFAWAARREVLAEGLYDRCLSGAADHLMAHALTGDFRSACLLRTFARNELLAAHFTAWGRTLHERVRARIGVVEGDVLHLWHGDRAHRRHTERSRELSALRFSPEEDLRVDDGGALAFAKDHPDLRAWSREFFRARKEDGE